MEEMIRDGSAAQASGTRANWTAVIVFLTLYAAAYLDRQVITLLVRPIRADLHISDFQVSLLQGAGFVLFFATCGLPIGWAVDRYPRRPIVFLGLLIWSLGAALGGLAGNFQQLLLSRFIVGAGEASLAPAAYSMLSDLFPKQQLGRAMGVFSVGAIIGGAISIALGGALAGLAAQMAAHPLPLLGVLSPWRLVFLIVGVFGFFLAPLIFLIREPGRRRLADTDKDNDKASMADALRFLGSQPGFYVAHILGFSLFNIMAAGYTNWAPTFLMRRFDLPVAKVGLLLGLITMASGAAGMLGSGMLADFLFRRGVRDAHLRLYAWGTLACGAAAVFAMNAPDLPLALAGMAVVSLFTPFIAVASAGLQIPTPSRYRGQVSAIFLLVYNVLGYGLGPSIMAGVSDFAFGARGGLGFAITITFAIFAPLSALTFALGLAPRRRAVDAAAAREAKDA
ncbi:MAG: MFS transporter [Caulobacteraceae bacterium]|nr:MFS transporter [Caulobacteraceae bacterium]